MFRPTDSDCADCGADAFAATDIFATGIRPMDEVTPLCFSCYVDRVGRVAACGLVRLETDGGFVVGAPSVEDADRTARLVTDELENAGVGASDVTVLPLTEARGVLGDYYARELVRGSMSASRHVYAATSGRGTVVDADTRTDEGVQGSVRDALAEYVYRGSRVLKRDDAYDAVAEKLPILAEHGTTRRLGVGRRVWRQAKENGVSRESERASQNRSAGREFEEFFRDWCDDHNIDVRRGKPALVRLYPEVAAQISRKTDGLAGVPDFLARGDEQRSFGDDWRPESDTFVEVKRGASRLSRDQQSVVAHLKSHGFDVYVLRGDPEEDGYMFEKR